MTIALNHTVHTSTDNRVPDTWPTVNTGPRVNSTPSTRMFTSENPAPSAATPAQDRLKILCKIELQVKSEYNSWKPDDSQTQPPTLVPSPTLHTLYATLAPPYTLYSSKPAMCEVCVNGMFYSLARVNSGVVNFIQACPPAFSELPRRSGKLSAAGYFECVVPAASERKLSLSFYSAMYCSLISLMDMGCR